MVGVIHARTKGGTMTMDSIDVRELRSQALAKKYGLNRKQKHFCDTYISLFSTPGEKASLANASRRVGCHEEYGRKLVKHENITRYIDEMMKPDLAMIYQRIDDVINGRVKEAHVCNVMDGDGTSHIEVIETSAPSKVISDCATTFLKIERDLQYRMAQLNIQKQKDKQVQPEYEGEIVDINDATLEALKSHTVEGFDEEVSTNEVDDNE